MSNENILRTLYGELRAPGLTNLKPLHEELSLLGMSATDEELLALKAIAESASSLEDAIGRIKTTDKSELIEIAQEQKQKLDAEKAKAKQLAIDKKEQNEKRRREKLEADQEAARIKEETLQRAEKAKKDEADAAKSARAAVKFANPETYISGYEILRAPTARGLQEQVKSHIDKGWTPLGGVCTYPMFAKVGISAQDLFYQAMVRYDYFKQR